MAKKEGRLSLYSSADGELRVALIKKMRENFGLALEMVTGTGAELTLKILNERKAGIYNIDVYIGGVPTILNDLKPQGVFNPISPQLFLPQVLDPKAWWGGELPYIDKDKTAVAFVTNISPPLAINTNIVGREEIKSYLDLLNPRWKGKMILMDPSAPGTASGWFAAVIGSGKLDLDYMRKLAQMDLTVTRDQRLQVAWLAQGKYLVAIAPQPISVSQFKKDGAPVELISLKEGGHVSSSSGNIATVNKAPHPNAAKLFINWHLTSEGQTIYTRSIFQQSARVDVPTDHLDSDSLRKPEENYFNSSNEEFIKLRPEYNKMAREIFGPLMR